MKAIRIIAGFLLMISLDSTVFSQSVHEIEYRFKAVYLFNFLQLIEWPQTAFASEESPLVVGILGKDPFGKLLDDVLKKERISVRPVVIRRYRDSEEVQNCHLLFISTSEGSRIPAILQQIRQWQTLTVSETEGFAGQGGGINFYVEKNRIRFEINVDALKRADLHASSKLLRLARIVNPSDS
ncbi:MAG: YfiR family protein [Bacteroidota bacterium]